MHHQFTGPVFHHGQRTFTHQAFVIKTHAHLGRHGQVRRHSLAHRRHQPGDRLRVLQHGGATAVAVHRLGRTTKIQINAFRIQACQIGGIGGHVVRIRPQQLCSHGHTGQSLAAIEQLGHEAQKHAVWQDGAADTNELRNAAVRAPHTGEHVTQHKIKQALHRGQKQSHGMVSAPLSAVHIYKKKWFQGRCSKRWQLSKKCPSTSQAAAYCRKHAAFLPGVFIFLSQQWGAISACSCNALPKPCWN